MSMCLAFPSSLELLRLRRAALADSGLPVDADPVALDAGRLSTFENVPAGSRASSDDEFASMSMGRRAWGAVLSRPVHLYVPAEGERRSSAVRVCSVGRGHLPHGAFSEVDGVWVPTPEYCFVEAGHSMGLVGQVLLGMELCGSYVLDAAGDAGFLRTSPVTTRERLAAFCANAPSLRGVKQARRAASLVLDRSASPAESRLAALLFFPKRLGGYELRPGRLNHRFEIARPGETGHSVRRNVVPDISWDDCTTVIEYDSDACHTGSSALAHDARRRNAFSAAGLSVLSVTNSQLQSTRDMDAVAVQLARRMGTRWRRPRRGEEWESRQDALRAALGLRVDRSDFDGWDPVVV